MKKFLSLLEMLLLMAGLLTPLLARAETDEISWSIQPRLAAGFMNYRFEYSFNAPNANQSSQTLNDYMPFMSAGAMFTYNNCFADTYFQQSVVVGEERVKKQSGTELTFNSTNQFDRTDTRSLWVVRHTKTGCFLLGTKSVKPI
jgi:hypothetical protein